MKTDKGVDGHDGWARLRFAVIGALLASPPPAGQLRAALEHLAQRDWEHPTREGTVRFAVSTIERWYYQARAAGDDPVAALRRRARVDSGRPRAMSPALLAALHDQYRAHPSWSVQLHHDNLKVLAAGKAELGTMPSYATLTRVMRRLGMVRQRRRRRFPADAGSLPGPREVLSYEVTRSHGLWHADYHHSACRVLTSSGAWRSPVLLGFIDDHSRVGCHLQWYLEETAETFVHGLCQALMKRGLPRALLNDNGAPMTAGEVTEGLHKLGILAATTQTNSPHQNGKCETWWATVEGRLMAMLEGVTPLTLKMLNDATIAWLEKDYNRRVHREIRTTPYARLADSVDASRPCPGQEALREAFCIARTRTLRRSDGTVSIEGVRFQVPAPWRHLNTLRVRYARWDLSRALIVDGRDRRLAVLLPLDKNAHADGLRRPVRRDRGVTPPPDTLPPLLQGLIDEQNATGLPPAWIPSRHDDPGDTS